MKMNVLSAVLASVGLATSAFGQNGTFVIEVRLVVDGDPNAPIGSGITSYAPGDGATRVGVSLQARVTQTASGTNAGSGNYGIAGVVTALGPSGLSQPRLVHNDSTYSGGAYLALKRGQTGAALGADGLPQAGFFGAENNPFDLLGGTAGRDFRQLGVNTGASHPYDVNSPTGNAPGATGNGDFPSSNGYFTDSAGGIGSIKSSINPLQASNPLAYPVGVASPWYNIYRAYFDPNPANGTVQRLVTVTFSGRLLAAVRSQIITGLGQSLSTGGSGGAQVDITNVSTSFTVGTIPAPAAGVVLGLGGLMAARRRRQV